MGPDRGAPSPVIHVETIDLSARGVMLPSDRVGMVIAQPYLSLTSTEPYRCTAEAKPRQMQMITDTLTVAIAAGHGASKTHFTVFPEYSIPGTEGIARVEAVLCSPQWPVGTVVIGGTDALSKSEFSSLVAGPNTNVDSANNGLDVIGEDEWINCEITWLSALHKLHQSRLKIEQCFTLECVTLLLPLIATDRFSGVSLPLVSSFIPRPFQEGTRGKTQKCGHQRQPIRCRHDL